MTLNEQAVDGGKEEEPFGLGCALDHFSDYEEVFEMVDNLKSLEGADLSTVERAYERFSFVLGQYIEQPHLIDSHIDALLEKFVLLVRDSGSSMELKHLAFQYMFVVVNVRGYKVITRHLPHEVADFEPILKLLEVQDPTDTDTWTTRYILLLWLSIIVMIPFHMSRFDTNDADQEKPIMERVLTIIKTYAIVPDKCRDAAAYLCHKFITRSDVKEKHLSSFLEWAKSMSLAEDFCRNGTLACVAAILKHGKREDLLPYAPQLLQWIVNAEFKNSVGSNVQKFVYKIIQRIGLIFLPPRIAAWRYKRGNRSLAANLSSGDGSGGTSVDQNVDEVEVEDINVPDEIEEVVDQLLQGLKSADSVVRWSVAKGLGRVTGRLPKDLADEVVGSVLELFSPRESDSAWHGGCIALAELGARGLLLPERLPEVVPVVLKALVYDEPKGYASVGSHIRDAACYVCWSFSRAYESHVLQPYIQDIANALLVVTCFDKEINCRRAAAAAFQENVGRQGTFPYGIDILTTADFFSVSVRNNAYLTISVYIAQYDEYKLALINHLVDRKVDHWDVNIRELTAKALHNLTPKAPDYMVSTVLPTLFRKAKTIDLNSRHGSVLAIGEVIYGLSKIENRSIKDDLCGELSEKTEELIPCFQENLYFRGLGGELMKLACCDFIEKCSLSLLPLQGKQVIDSWLHLLNECLSHETSNVRSAAVKALPYLLNQYYLNEPTKCGHLVEQYIKELLHTSLEFHRQGHCLALGALPKFVLQPNLNSILNALIRATVIHANTLKWAESRRDAIKALGLISVTMTDSLGKEFSKEYVLEIYDTFFKGLKDYTQDKRGDVGAWVRQASIVGLQTLTQILVKYLPEVLSEELVNTVLSGIAQQALEKIDRTRALAGKTFCSLIYSEPEIPNIQYVNEIRGLFPKEDCDNINWNSASATFPKFVKLIDLPSYTYNVLLGLISSIGGLTETLVKNSSSSFFAHLNQLMETEGKDGIKRICDTIYKIFLDHQRVDRITVPLFRFLEKLFDSGCLEIIIRDPESTFAADVLVLIQKEINGCKDASKLIDGISVLCQFIQIKGRVCEKALFQLSILLGHRQLYVRRSTASKLFESILINGENSNINPEKLDEIMNVLSSTNWELPIEEVRPIRNDLCRLMGIRVPEPMKKKVQTDTT